MDLGIQQPKMIIGVNWKKTDDLKQIDGVQGNLETFTWTVCML